MEYVFTYIRILWQNQEKNERKEERELQKTKFSIIDLSFYYHMCMQILIDLSINHVANDESAW